MLHITEWVYWSIVATSIVEKCENRVLRGADAGSISQYVGNNFLHPSDKGIEILFSEKHTIFKIHEIIRVRGHNALQLCAFQESYFVGRQKCDNCSVIRSF